VRNFEHRHSGIRYVTPPSAGAASRAGGPGDPGCTPSDVPPGPRVPSCALVPWDTRLDTGRRGYAQSGARCCRARSRPCWRHRAVGCMNQATTILTCSAQHGAERGASCIRNRKASGAGAVGAVV